MNLANLFSTPSPHARAGDVGDGTSVGTLVNRSKGHLDTYRERIVFQPLIFKGYMAIYVKLWLCTI